ncbi:Uncharacterised protein [Chromobacterium violaceum]|uniref:Uncharacterized protein n=1 Tax=Chromobacterium violaceum TaxID=536 RepID=A0A447T6Q6_CHRVL|nr:Uncharacterised protein [Chromobacterium violaceum]
MVAQPVYGAFLQEAQQAHLCFNGHVSDFIQKQGAIVGSLDAADTTE